MGRYRIPPMSAKQATFIQNLVDQLGYKDSPHKNYFLEKIGFNKADIEYASILIDSLLSENKRRKFFRHKNIDKEEVPTVQDLAQFVFCPASYAIKSTFIIERNQENQLDDNNEPTKSFLLERIAILKLPLEKIKEEAKEHFKMIYEGQFNDFKRFIESTLVYNGYSNIGSQYKYNKEHNINGRPHLIFQNNMGERTLVLEKTTYKDIIPDIIWDNNLVQALAYLYLFEEFNCSQAVIICWRSTIDGQWDLDREYKIFNLSKSDSNNKLLLNELNLFKKFRNEKKIPFNSESLNPAKCFKCSCRALCNHKSGLINDLLFPYSTPEYSKKYPLYYTWKEEMELIAMEHQEIMDDLAEIQSKIDIDDLPDEIIRQLNKGKNQDDETIF